MNRYYRNRTKRQATRLTERFQKETGLPAEHIDVRTFYATAHDMLGTQNQAVFEHAAESLRNLVLRYQHVENNEATSQTQDSPTGELV